MKYLTAEQILFVHARLIAETGGSHGVRDIGLLESAVARPQATFGGEDLYPDLCTKAAVLMVSLTNNHAFVDGNKRTGVAAAGLFLRRNGRRLTATNEELEELSLRVVGCKADAAEIGVWFRTHSSPLL